MLRQIESYRNEADGRGEELIIKVKLVTQLLMSPHLSIYPFTPRLRAGHIFNPTLLRQKWDACQP